MPTPTGFPAAVHPGRLIGLLLLSICLGLAGCANAPAGVTISDTATRQGQASWWNDFNDPLMSRLVEQALQANTDVRSAQAALQQARALRDVKRAALLPSVGLSGSASRSQTEHSDAINAFSTGLDASWEADLFGGNRANLNASDADAAAANASLRDVQVSVAAEVALAYIQLRGAQAQLDIARCNLASQQETLQITEWRAQAGLATTLDVAQARTTVAQTSAQIPALQTVIDKVRHSLAVLTGQRPRELDAPLSLVRPVPDSGASTLPTIPADTLRQRADVRAAEFRLQAALARVDAADAARYPSLKLGGSLSLSAATLAGLTSGATLASQLLAGVSLPLLDGGATQGQLLAQQAALEQARASYQGTLLAALQDVEDALSALRLDGERLIQLRRAADAAAAAALLAQDRYAGGLIDFPTLLQTQRTLLSAQDSAASAQADLSADRIRLVKALGGSWPQRGSPTP